MRMVSSRYTRGHDRIYILTTHQTLEYCFFPLNLFWVFKNQKVPWLLEYFLSFSTGQFRKYAREPTVNTNKCSTAEKCKYTCIYIIIVFFFRSRNSIHVVWLTSAIIIRNALNYTLRNTFKSSIEKDLFLLITLSNHNISNNNDRCWDGQGRKKSPTSC